MQLCYVLKLLFTKTKLKDFFKFPEPQNLKNYIIKQTRYHYLAPNGMFFILTVKVHNV